MVNGKPFYLPRSGDEIHPSADQGDVYGLAGGMLREGPVTRRGSSLPRSSVTLGRPRP